MSNRPTRYKLETRITIVREEWNGGVFGDGAIDEKNGYWTNNQNERLSVDESMDLGSMDYIGVMGILGKLHEAMKAIKETS
jgi:hypothetical protein